MSELLPCPFCGGEAHISASSDGYGVECWNRRCIDMQLEELPTEAEAIAAWNTRTGELSGVLEALPMTKENMAEHGWVRERTCTNASYRLDESRFHCSECGFGCWVKNVATGRDELPQHCPNCGAKVVEQ